MNDRIRKQIDSELSPEQFVTSERLKKLEKLSERKDIKMKINKKFIVGGVAAALVAGSAITVGAVNEWNYQRVVERAFPRAVVAETTPAELPERKEDFLLTSAVSSEPVPELVEEVAKTLDGLMYPVSSENITSTFTKYDVSIDGYVCDGANVYIPITVRSKDGTPFTYDEKGRVHYDMYVGLYLDDGRDIVSEGRYGITDDGAFQMVAVGSVRNGIITEPANARLTVSYLMYDGPMKLHDVEDVHDLGDDVLLDDGVLTADITLYPNDSVKELVLTDRNGDTVTLRISQTKITVNFAPIPHPTDEDERYMMMLNDTLFLYDADGNVIYSSGNSAGGGGSEYEGFVYSNLAKPIDVSRVASARSGNYVSENAPELDTSVFEPDYLDYLREYFGADF